MGPPLQENIMKPNAKLYVSNGSKYRLELHDGSTMKAIWSTGKFCFLGNLGRTRIPIDLVKRVAVIDSNLKPDSAFHGWFPTSRIYLDKWQPQHRDVWVHPYSKQASAIPMRVPAHG